MKWQPIETAPKDRAVLVYGPSLDPRGIVFSKTIRTAMPSGGEWIGHGDYFKLTPTHWMDLPDPPSAHNARPTENASETLPSDDAEPTAKTTDEQS